MLDVLKCELELKCPHPGFLLDLIAMTEQFLLFEI